MRPFLGCGTLRVAAPGRMGHGRKHAAMAITVLGDILSPRERRRISGNRHGPGEAAQRSTLQRAEAWGGQRSDGTAQPDQLSPWGVDHRQGLRDGLRDGDPLYPAVTARA
jgi:hypothetical protein